MKKKLVEQVSWKLPVLDMSIFVEKNLVFNISSYKNV